MNVNTGKPLDGIGHLRQSIRDILTTPIGSRVMCREYGSRWFELVDRPVNAAWRLDAFMYTAEALDRWEARFRLIRTKVAELADGSVVLDLEGQYLLDGSRIKLEGIVI